MSACVIRLLENETSFQDEVIKEHAIVERLKKQIEELAEGCYLKTELQKILGKDSVGE